MKIPLLDHGYVEPIESWGSDERIIEAARMSTAKGFQGWDKDAKLLAYLYHHKHSTPFEMAGLVIEVKAPIFVFREWHRHRTQSYNEMSARYVPLPDENYVPDLEDTLARAIRGATARNRQSSGTAIEISQSRIAAWHARLLSIDQLLEEFYQEGLQAGVPKEIARIRLPMGRYTKMRASANLRNWLAFLTLRLAPEAQQEIREYAEAVGKIVAVYFPRTWALFETDQAIKQL